MSNNDFKITTIKQRKEIAKKEPLINYISNIYLMLIIFVIKINMIIHGNEV